MKAYHLRSHPDIAKMLCNYFDLKAKEKQYLSDISAMENALTTGRQIESTESLIRSIVFARHEHIGGASNRTSDSTYNAVNQLSHEIQAQDKATDAAGPSAYRCGRRNSRSADRRRRRRATRTSARATPALRRARQPGCRRSAERSKSRCP